MTRRRAGSNGKSKPDSDITAYLNQVHAMAMEKIAQIHEEYKRSILDIVASWAEPDGAAGDVTTENEITAEGTYRQRHEGESPEKFCEMPLAHEAHDWRPSPEGNEYLCLGVRPSPTPREEVSRGSEDSGKPAQED